MPMMQTRRRFLTTTLSLAGAAGFVRARPALAAEGAPEITSVRIQKSPSICNAPRYVAEELLRAEGFTDIRYVSVPSDAVVVLVVVLLSVWIISRPERGTTGSVNTKFRLLGPDDKIVVDGFDDPKVEGVACHISRAQTGGMKGAF